MYNVHCTCINNPLYLYTIYSILYNPMYTTKGQLLEKVPNYSFIHVPFS